MIKEESYIQFYKNMQNKANTLGIPLSGGFEITSRCNLNCKMCYIKTSKVNVSKELTTAQWIRLGQEAAENGTLITFITGGEPLLRSDFKEIYEAFCRLGFRLTLYTNGTLFTEELVRWLSSIPPAAIDITLYGASEDTYQKLCGSADAYGRVMNSIGMLLKHGLNVSLKSTIVKTNLKDYKIIKAFAEKLNLTFLSTTTINGHRDPSVKSCFDVRLTPDEIYHYSLENSEDCDQALVDILKFKNNFINLPALLCTAAKSSFFINWMGQLTPCPLFVVPYTEPLKTGFARAWEEIKEKALAIPVPEKCISCDKRAFCPACPGKTYLETGTFDQHAEYLCELAKIREAQIEKVIG